MPYAPPKYIVHDVGSLQTLSENYSWGITDLRIPEAWKKTTGKDVTIAILDSGCSIHTDLRDNINYKLSRTFIPNEDMYDSFVGHGTHVAGILGAKKNNSGLVGVAPDVTVVTIKVLGKNGMSVGDSINKGLDYCFDLKPDIINMSLGSPEPQDYMHRQIKKLTEMGIVVVCAAGNNGEEKILYPAQFDEAIAVGSYSPTTIRSRSIFSSYGDTLDIMAPGEEIVSTWINNKYSVLSGTSMAAPFVSGAIALMLSYYKQQGIKLSVDEIKEKLMRNCIDIGARGKDKYTGWGIINPEHIFLPLGAQKKQSFWQKLLAKFLK